MDKIKAFISDKKNQPIVGAVAGIILVLVVLFYLKQFGIMGGKSSSQAGYPTGTDTSTTGTTPTESVPPMGPTNSTATTTTATAAPTPVAVTDKIPPMLAYRKDPFMGYSGVPKKSDLLMTLLPGVRHPRLAPFILPPPPPGESPEEVLPPQPMRRVAGIMWGTTVKAILESGGKTYIVQPGQVIPEERVRVESIEPSGLTLTTLDTKRPMRIQVKLAGSPTAQQDQGDNTGMEAPPDQGYQRPRPGRPGPGGQPIEEPPPGF